MAEHDAAERLAAHLREGLAAMKRQAWDRALLHLRPVARSDAWAGADDLGDVQARVLTLLAQTLLERGDVADHDEIEAALGRARLCDPSPEGAAAVSSLDERLQDARRTALEAAAAQARAQRLADADIEPWLERLADPDRRCDLLTQKAAAELAEGRPQAAAAFAERAMALPEAASLRSQVMARLVMARTHPADAQPYVLRALAMADAASEFTLVGTVAKTAELLGVELPVQQGPTASKERT